MTSLDSHMRKSLLPAVRLNRRSGWEVFAIVVMVVVLVPAIVLGLIAAGGGRSSFDTLLTQGLVRALGDTLTLATGVLFLSIIIGVGTGWLIATYRFPGRNTLGWLLILPFAVPTYISAYAYVEALDFFGPIQTGLRYVFGYGSRQAYWFPDIRTQGGAIFVNAVVLFPYVYVASRAAFTMQGGLLTDAARLLGCSRMEALRRVVLPAIWPGIAAGSTLVLLETLNDIGASQYLGVETLTVAIYNTWLTRGSLAGAAQLSMLVLCLVLGVLWLERSARNNQRYMHSSRHYKAMASPQLLGMRAVAAFLLCLMPVMAGFVIPVGILVHTAWREVARDGLSPDLLMATKNTLMVATFATLLVMLVAFLLSLAHRFNETKVTGIAVRLSTIGYALPGTVLVIGLLPALGFFDTAFNNAIIALGGARVGLLLSGSILVIVLAYTIRFMAIGVEQIRSGMENVSRNTDFAAQSLGSTQWQVGWTIHLPILRPVLAGATVLVFVDCLKELPATLLLRPLNFETLATYLYGSASRGTFDDVAPAALIIVAAGLIPLITMNRLMERH